MVLAISAVLGCGHGVAPPTFTVPVSNNSGFGDFALLVYDESGLITGGIAAGPIDRGVSNGDITMSPDELQLTLRWSGGACSHRPTLTLTGSATALKLELQTSPPEWRLPFLSCPAVGIPMGVTLSLSAPVEQSAVSTDVRY